MTPNPTRAAHAPAPRFDLYAPVHKGLRAFLGDTLVRLGQMDATDDPSVKTALDQLDALLDHCESHLHKEEHHVHPAIESRRAGFTARIAGEHRQHADAILALRAAADALACAKVGERDAAAAVLYRRFAGFVADNLVHMEVEESQHSPILWSCFDDAALAAINAQIVAATAPVDLALGARWIVPHVSPAERSRLLAGARATLPASAFDGLIEMLRPHLSADQARQLALEFDVPAMGRAGCARELVARFLDAAFVRFDVAEAAALVSADFVAHPWAALGAPPGPAGLAMILPAFAQAFSDVQAEVVDVLADGDRIAARYRYAGRHDGALFGMAPTRRAFQIAGIAIMRIDADGRIAEFWREEDMLTLQRQLGLASMLPEHHVEA